MFNPDRVTKAIALFPETFGIRAFPGGLFTINERASYIDSNGEIQLYVYDSRGQAFSKATVAELEGVITR